MKRMGKVIGLSAADVVEYKKAHAAVWPEVLRLIRAAGITNYSIYLKEPENLLFAYMEYGGTDEAADMAIMAASPEMQRWWAWMEPMQRPLETRKPGEWWADMEEVFHTD